LHDNATHQEEYDRACIAYVVLTRARDRLIISQSRELGRQPNPLFDQVITELSKKNLVEKVKWPLSQPPVAPTLDRRSAPLIFAKPIPFSLLSQLSHCGQAAKYQVVYGLIGESSGYLLALKAIRTTLQWVSEKWADGQHPSLTEIDQFMEVFWEDETPGARQISGFYRPFALERVSAVLDRQAALGQTKWHQPQVFKLSSGQEVSYHVDEVEFRAGEVPIVRLHQWHAQSPTESQKLQLALYTSLDFDGNKPQVFLYNSLDNSDIPIVIPDYEYKKRIRRIEKLAETLIRGDFQLRKGRHCNYCPFLLICPS
jgi:hypothetical protein